MTARQYLLNMPILISVVITDPSISPKNLPAYQKRERAKKQTKKNTHSVRRPVWLNILNSHHDKLTDRISIPYLGVHPFHFHLNVNCTINYSSNYVILCIGLKVMYLITHDFVEELPSHALSRGGPFQESF